MAKCSAEIKVFVFYSATAHTLNRCVQFNEYLMSYSQFLKEARKLQDSLQKEGVKNISYDRAWELLRDIWIKDKRYNELINYINENWDSGNGDVFFNPLSQQLIKEKELQYFKKLWKGQLRHRFYSFWSTVNRFFYNYPDVTFEQIVKTDTKGFNQHLPDSNIREIAWKREYSLEGIEKYIDGLKTLSDFKEVEKFEKIYLNVFNLTQPKPKRSTDKRKIDEELFWSLIELNREKSEDKFEFIENLSNQLEEFKSTEIIKFYRILLNKIEELNHWEIWALAYISRQGCGDDEFDYFKPWVISKGKKLFEFIKAKNFTNVKPYFDEDPQLEELLYVCENIYEKKTNEIIPNVRVKRQKMSGEQWEEENLANEFPEIYKMFN